MYEEGEDAPEQTYKDILKSFHEKMNVFQLWKTKFMQMKAKEEEKRRFIEQQDMQRKQHPQQRNTEFSQNRNPDQRVSRQMFDSIYDMFLYLLGYASCFICNLYIHKCIHCN